MQMTSTHSAWQTDENTMCLLVAFFFSVCTVFSFSLSVIEMFCFSLSVVEMQQDNPLGSSSLHYEDGSSKLVRFNLWASITAESDCRVTQMLQRMHVQHVYNTAYTCSTGVAEPQRTSIFFPYYVYIHSPSTLKRMAICVSQPVNNINISHVTSAR